MRRRLLIAGLLFGLVLTMSAAQDSKKEKPKTGAEVDINFLNGSTVRMIVQSEKLEIETPYGKLIVPMTQVRAIEFGSHMPAGHAEKIQTAVQQLGSTDFRVREKAASALVELGPYSYAAVLEASRSKQAETASRAKAVVQKLEAKHPKKDLKVTADDRVVTPTFPIVGRILTPSIKVKADYFGEVQLSLADMRTLRGAGAVGLPLAVSIDAAKYGTRDRSQWLATSFEVDGRTPILITATGQIDIWPENGGQYIVGPAGNRLNRAGFAGGKLKGSTIAAGALIGKIGPNGDTFAIGERYLGTPTQSGKLYLQINPSTYTNQSLGSYEVKAVRKLD